MPPASPPGMVTDPALARLTIINRFLPCENGVCPHSGCHRYLAMAALPQPHTAAILTATYLRSTASASAHSLCTAPPNFPPSAYRTA